MLFSGLLDEEICDMSVDHFRKQLDSELKRISELCNTWDKIYEQTVLPDEIQVGGYVTLLKISTNYQALKNISSN